MLSALFNPLLWTVFAISCLDGHDAFGQQNAWPLWLSFSGLAGGNAILTLLAIVGSRRRGWNELVPYAPAVTLYWAMVSLAAYRGLWQLITKPFYWEKTDHGVSRLTRRAQ